MQNATHMLSVFANIYFCKKIRTKISKMVCQDKQGQRIPVKILIRFFIYVIILFVFNQILMSFMKQPNLYQEIQCPRRYTLSEVKKHGDDLKINIMTLQNMPIQHRIHNIKKLQQIVNVLSHPARRLSYDSFGYAQTQFAWAFKSQQFLMSMIIQSAVFYVITTLMSLISTNKAELKQALKTEMIVMILLFIWEVDLILNTQSNLFSNTPDFLDNFYFAFPLFERRDFIKSLVIPSMNLVDIFVRCFVKSGSYKKIQFLGNHSELRLITNQVTSQIKAPDVYDQNYQDKIDKMIVQAGRRNEINSRIFSLQRKVIHSLFLLDLENILPDVTMNRIMDYYKFKVIKPVQ